MVFILRILCPYASVASERRHLNVGLCPETGAALSGWPTEFVEMLAPESYFELFRDLWTTRQTTAIVEQDVAPTRAQLEDLATCDQEWCAFPYRLRTGLRTALGCTRFSGALMGRLPGVPDQVAAICDDLPARHWLRLDVRVDRVLRAEGLTPHVHMPEVRHLNPYHQHRPFGAR